MRILLVTHYFPPEIGAPQARLSEMAAVWAEAGDEVTVITGMPNHPTGVVHSEYKGRWRAYETSDGYRIIRTWLFATPNEGIAKKTLGHVSFMLTSIFVRAGVTGPADVVIVSSPTFFSIFSAWVHAKRRRAKFVVEVRDLWPGIFVELGVLTNRWIIRILERLELAAYHAADLVVVVSEGFRKHIAGRGISPEKIRTIRNGVDLERFGQELPTTASDRMRLGARPDEPVVLYIGAHGISHGLESVADAAAILREDSVHFAFVGEGAAKAALQERVQEHDLDNVSLHPGVPRDEVPELLAAADICLVPLRDVPLFSTFIPSKLFEYFAAGKAVIGAVRGEPAAILQEGGAVVVEPENPPALAQAIRDLSADPALRTKMGDQARTFVTEHFDRRKLAMAYRTLLAELTEPSRRRP
jgi:glycosyltransferase involved in cell wall biosynthesis